MKKRQNPTVRIKSRCSDGDDEDELAELIAQGIARPPRTARALPDSFWSEPLPEASVDLLALIREDRESR